MLADATVCLSIEFERGRSRKSVFEAPCARARRNGRVPAAAALCSWTPLRLLQTSRKRVSELQPVPVSDSSLQKGIFFKVLASPNSAKCSQSSTLGRNRSAPPPPPSPSLNHYSLIHFSQPGVIMHGPVSGYLCMPRVYLIISRSGGEIKALTAFIVERFLQAWRLK